MQIQKIFLLSIFFLLQTNYESNKIEAEQNLLKRNPNAYILRPPYLYGQMNTGEAFEWYIHNPNQVNKKPLIDFIDSNLA